MGHCSVVKQDEIGDKSVVIFEHQSTDGCSIATLTLRAATSNIMDDLERAVDDGVNNYKVFTRVSDCRFSVKGMVIDNYPCSPRFGPF